MEPAIDPADASALTSAPTRLLGIVHVALQVVDL